jgi:hypothetical protein
MSSLLPKHIRLGRDFSSLPSRNAHKKRADQVIDSSCSIRSQQALHARRELVQPRLHGTATLAEMRRDLAHCGPWMLGEMLTPFLLGLRKFLTRRPKQVCYQYVTSVLPVRDSCVTQSFSILYRIVSSTGSFPLQGSTRGGKANHCLKRLSLLYSQGRGRNVLCFPSGIETCMTCNRVQVIDGVEMSSASRLGLTPPWWGSAR